VGAIVSDVSSAETQMAQAIAEIEAARAYKIASHVDDVNHAASDFTTDVINMKTKASMRST